MPDYKKLPEDQIYIRSASVYRLGGLLRTTDLNIHAGELRDDHFRPILGIERATDLVEVELIQLSGPPAHLSVVLVWWPFIGGHYGYLGSTAQSQGPGEIAVRFDPKGYRVPAMFGIGAVDAREKGPEPEPRPLPIQYDKRDITLDYIIGRGIVLSPLRPELPTPARGECILVQGRELLVTALEYNASRTHWSAIVREVEQIDA